MFPFNWGKIVSFCRLPNGRAVPPVRLHFGLLPNVYLFFVFSSLAIAIVVRRRIRIYICVLDYYF